jgi:outer membrane lipoprotein carrier protein
VVERVQSRYDGVEHLQAGFQQRTRSIALGGSEIGDSVARGRVMFAKPGRMRWSYESPEPSLVVSDGETLWIYDPAAQEVQELPVGQGFLSGTVIQFLLGEGRIVESFDVRAEGCDQDRVRLSLLPRTAATYEYLELLVGARDGAIFETAIVDLFGNRTEMVFEGLRTDLVAPDELFRFVAEPGVRVLRLPPQGEAAGTQ